MPATRVLHGGVGMLLVAMGVGAGATSCSAHSTPSNPDAGPAPLTTSELMDPSSCSGCHGDRYREWFGSMHAYAGVDPVFLAMNARGQRETNGQLGSFCVSCHAPVALRTGATTDGLNLASLATPLKGVTCYFCHATSDVAGTHNDPLTLASDGALRAAIRDPITDQRPHGAAYNLLQDGTAIGSSALCGSCHDIQNQHGLDVETTFAEWKASEFANLQGANDNTRSCGACHMAASDGPAALIEGAPTRRVHDHSMAAVDTALSLFPETDHQRAAVQALLDPAIAVKLCVAAPGGTGGMLSATVTLQTNAVGHAFPSGASQDRRMWLELVASAAGQMVFQSGVVADTDPIIKLQDPNLWLFRQTMRDANNQEVAFMWQATSSTSTTLGAPLTVGQDRPSSKVYAVPSNADRIDVRVRVEPIGQEVLDDLVASGDLDPKVRAATPTLTLAKSAVSWTAGQSCAMTTP